MQSPVPSQIERFGKPAKLPPHITLELVAQLSARCWFIHQSETRLLQIQNDRFIHNWRKVGPVRPTLTMRVSGQFLCRSGLDSVSSCNAQQIGSPEIRQCEIVYVNHLDAGHGWKSLADLPGVVGSRIGAGTDQFLPGPENAARMASYAIPGERGRLHIQLQPVIRHADGAETLQLTLTARGRPASSQVADLLLWFDLGREWVVRGFADFTTAKMHALWQRKRSL